MCPRVSTGAQVSVLTPSSLLLLTLSVVDWEGWLAGVNWVTSWGDRPLSGATSLVAAIGCAILLVLEFRHGAFAWK